MSFLFKNNSLVKVIYLLTSLFLLNANNTDRNGVNEQNTHTYTHTPNTQRKIKLERVNMKISEIPPFLTQP